MENFLLNSVYGHIVKTVVALSVLLVIYFLIGLVIFRNVQRRSVRRQLRLRSFYIIMLIFFIVLARIWISGFSQVLTILGLVSAALVVINKESIMSFVGWLIISWRELFIEDDFIQVLQYRGLVTKIGLMYTTLWETEDNTEERITGRILRLPNNMFITNVVINYSHTHHVVLGHFNVLIKPTDEIASITTELLVLMESVLNEFQEKKAKPMRQFLHERNRRFIDYIYEKPQANLTIKNDKPAGLLITLKYHCYDKEEAAIQQEMTRRVLALAESHKNFSIVYQSLLD